MSCAFGVCCAAVGMGKSPTAIMQIAANTRKAERLMLRKDARNEIIGHLSATSQGGIANTRQRLQKHTTQRRGAQRKWIGGGFRLPGHSDTSKSRYKKLKYNKSCSNSNDYMSDAGWCYRCPLRLPWCQVFCSGRRFEPLTGTIGSTRERRLERYRLISTPN